MHGTVTAFDEYVGLGEVTSDDGAVFPFHCIDLADGTRSTAVGTAVTFEVHTKLGRLEARAVAVA